MTITSKHHHSEDDFAWSLSIIGGEKQQTIPASLSRGSKIEVRDLFFATPARLKFLKTEKTETNYIIETLSKIAMANPAVAISLTSDGKEILNLEAYRGQDALYNRLNDLANKGFEENFTYIEYNDADCKVFGYISTPTYNAGTSNEQHFFINKRPVKDKLLSIAAKIAYQDFIPSGRYPLVYLFLELNSAFVDVNVHPAKAEVRFKDANLIKSCVISAIKQGIRNIGNKASNHLTDAVIEAFTPQLEEAPRPQYIQAARPNFIRPIINQSMQTAIFAPIAPMTKAQPQEFDVAQTDFPLGAACGQIHDTYIISQTKDGMILVDQHAAHERIFYERLKMQILNKQIQTQRLFIPEIIELPEHIIEHLLSQQDEFAKLGLYFESFGSAAISVTELPSLLRCLDVKKLIMDIVDDLSEYTQQVSLENKINHYLATFACHHSIRAGRSLSIHEMNNLLREMENIDHTGQCNHGRPTYIKLSLKDMEKLFERC